MDKIKETLPLVSVCCLAYNQHRYIKECIEGVIKQQTSFLIEILIQDDASDDGTAEIIRHYAAKYPELIHPVFQTENQYSKGVSIVQPLYDLAKGKYIAFCDGDDYWIDPLKLQKQVDYLECNPDCGLICTDFKRYIQGYDLFEKSNTGNSSHLTYKDIILGQATILLSSACLRRRFIENRDYTHLDPAYYFKGDALLFLDISLYSYIYFSSDITTVYRMLKNSISHPDNYIERCKFSYMMSNTILYFLQKRPLTDPKQQKKTEFRHRISVLSYLLRCIFLLNCVR